MARTFTSGNWLERTALSSRPTQDCTIFLRIKPTWSSGDSTTHFFLHYATENTNNRIFFAAISDNTVICVCCVDSFNWYLPFSTAGLFTAGVWANWRLEIEGSTGHIRVYKNGSLVGNYAGPGFTAINGVLPKFLVGDADGGGGAANADIAEVAEWNHVLSSEDSALLESTGNPACVATGLVRHYKILGTDSPEPDEIGSDDLSLVGTPAAATHPTVSSCPVAPSPFPWRSRKAVNRTPKYPFGNQQFGMNPKSNQTRDLVFWYHGLQGAVDSLHDLRYISGWGGVYLTGWASGPPVPFEVRTEPSYAAYLDWNDPAFSFSDFANISPITVSMWIAVRGTGTGGGGGGVAWYLGQTGWTNGLYVGVGAGNAPAVIKVTAGFATFNQAPAITPMLLNQWYLVTAVAEDDQVLKIYVNGILEGDVWTGTPVAGVNPNILRMGSEWAGGNLANASYSDFRMYKRALSPAEIWALYDPATRGELYQAPSRMIFTPGSAPPPSGGRTWDHHHILGMQ